jgi:hypothetical protein
VSEGADPPDAPTPDETPAEKSLWDRYREAATWVKVALPVALVAVLVALGALIANAVSDDSTTASVTGSTTTTAPNNTTALLLVATATQLASDETSTSIATTTIPSTAAVPETTTSTEASTTTTAAATTTPPTSPTTAQPVATTAPTTAPPATTSTATTSTATTAPPTTTSTSSTTAPPTTTTNKPTTTTSVFQLPAGEIAVSPNAFKDAWNAAAKAGGVASISTWTQKPLAGQTGSGTSLGGNLRLVLLSNTDDSPVAAAVLAWLPLSDPSQQAEQNAAFQKAFDVLMTTVTASATSEQQATVATQLGLSATAPPFPDGSAANATLEGSQYQLKALVPAGQSGVYTLIGVSESS